MDFSNLSMTQIRLLFKPRLNGSCVCVNDCVYGWWYKRNCVVEQCCVGVWLYCKGFAAAVLLAVIGGLFVIVVHLFSYFELKLVQSL